jgi:hypothetical protein
VTLDSLTIRNGSAADPYPGYIGGGVFNYGDGTVTVTSSTISDNSAIHGGGIANSGGTLAATAPGASTWRTTRRRTARSLTAASRLASIR